MQNDKTVTDKTQNDKTVTDKAQDGNEMSSNGYAEQLHLFNKKEKSLEEQIPFFVKKALKKADQKLIKNLNSNFFFDLDEDKVNEETRKIGIDLLNKTLKNLSTIVEQDTQMPIYQRSCILLSISKMILGVR